MQNFTPEDLTELKQMENEMMNWLFAEDIEEPCEPSDETVNTLLAYSKSLSIRKSRTMKTIRLVLN
ncbi:MAG: hypothetical protein ACKO7B_04225 [Flavobacteriales bacterium]